MGQIWRAHDTRLARQVAIEVLPEIYAVDPERRAQFEREARRQSSDADRERVEGVKW